MQCIILLIILVLSNTGLFAQNPMVAPQHNPAREDYEGMRKASLL